MQVSYWARFYEDDQGRGYTVDVPDLPGCLTEGDSWDEALYMATDAMRGWLEDELEEGRPLPPARVRAEVAALSADAEMGEPILAEVAVSVFGGQSGLPQALWADLALVSRREGLSVADLLARAVREYLGRRQDQL